MKYFGKYEKNAVAKANKSLLTTYITSLLSLVLCVTMFLSTTFAWFTSEVTSGGNQIHIGQLKVALHHKVGGIWTEVNSEHIIFDENAKWEPDHTEIQVLKISAAETDLAFKYQLSLVMDKEAVEDELAALGSVGKDIAIYVADGENPGNADWVNVGTLDEMMKGNIVLASGTVQENSSTFESVVSVKLHMSPSATGEGAQGKVLPVFYVQLVATQLSVKENYVSSQEELEAALEAGMTPINVISPFALSETINIFQNVVINGNGYALTRAAGFTGTMFTVEAGTTLTTENITLDGGAVWTGEVDSVLQRGITNSGTVATANLIATEGDGSIVLNAGTVLQNNDGSHAVSLATRGGGSLTLNGGQIINNQSDSGAIWGGGAIIVNEGSKINGNSSTGSAGAIRMVSDCNLTINGGEINHNKAAADGGAIWGYGSSTYTFNGGEMAYNEASGVGGAIYTGNYSVINISGNFKLHDNKAADSGAIRLTDHTSLNMTGGKVYNNMQNGQSNAFNTWNNAITITGGEISDNFSFVGGLGLTIGAADIDGVISFDLSTNHNTAYLKKDFTEFKFMVNESDEHFVNFNFKPEDGYTYIEGDEAKLICQNEGYSTYWDAETGTFKLQEEV